VTPLERAFREERAQVVATVARRLGDLQLAEDAVSEAFAAAAATWPSAGVPDRPGAWLTTTAWRKALDVVRRDRSAPGEPVEQPAPPTPEPGLQGEDDLLQLVLTCCHPALAIEGRVALTLRHVAGLAVAEIAAGFLVPEETMAKRLVRARTKIRQSGISFELPGPEGLPERLSSVQAVLYLVFTEGHLASGSGPAVRTELCEEAIWLTRQVHRLLPGDCETTGLLALMLFQHSRVDARHDDTGRLVPFPEQDRARWDDGAIAEARALLATTGLGPIGPYQLQAAIAALHAAATTADDLNWPRIADLYGLLDRIAPSPVVTVNRAVAVGRADGPRAALALLGPVLADGRLDGYAPLHAAHADLLERAGATGAAVAAWRRAAGLSRNAEEQAALERRIPGV
jgi:RNA polymerase sigma-70 factor, ECF subfamily